MFNFPFSNIQHHPLRGDITNYIFSINFPKMSRFVNIFFTAEGKDIWKCKDVVSLNKYHQTSLLQYNKPSIYWLKLIKIVSINTGPYQYYVYIRIALHPQSEETDGRASEYKPPVVTNGDYIFQSLHSVQKRTINLMLISNSCIIYVN